MSPLENGATPEPDLQANKRGTNRHRFKQASGTTLFSRHDCALTCRIGVKFGCAHCVLMNKNKNSFDPLGCRRLVPIWAGVELALGSHCVRLYAGGTHLELRSYSRDVLADRDLSLCLIRALGLIVDPH